MTATQTKTRWMIRNDLKAVVALEKANGGKWEEANFLNWFKARNHIGAVAYEGDQVKGFLLYSLQRSSIKLARLVGENSEAVAALGAKFIWKCGTHRRAHIILPSARKWVTSEVRDLCRADDAYPPVLADAMDEAGCPYPWLVAALRGWDGDEAQAVFKRIRQQLGK